MQLVRRSLVIPAGAACLFAGLLALIVTRTEPVIRLDAAISAAALRIALHHSAWRMVMLAVTQTGGPTVIAVAAVAAVAGLLGLRRWGDALFVAVAVAGSTGLRLIVLSIVARPRPVEQLAPAAGWSFPSGHATAAAAAALIAIMVGRPLLASARLRRALAAVLLFWAAAVGASRVALVVHWPTDVLGAWLLVAAVVTAASPLRRVASPRTAEASAD